MKLLFRCSGRKGFSIGETGRLLPGNAKTTCGNMSVPLTRISRADSQRGAKQKLARCSTCSRRNSELASARRNNGGPCSSSSFDVAMSKPARKSSKTKRWSAGVTKHSDALDLQPKVFRSSNPRRVALSLKRSAERSHRRKGTPYQSAMSMLNFYINRAGKNLSKKQKHVLEKAKDELRDVFGRN